MESAVFFYNDAGEKIAGTLHMPEKTPECGVVLGHCFTCSRHTSILRDISRALVMKNIAALRFDFSGNGQSEGDFPNTTYTRHIAEMKQAVDFLGKQGISRFGLAGHSMGASIAILSAAGLPPGRIKGVCALAGRLADGNSALLFSPEQMEQLRQDGKFEFVSRGRKLELSRNFFDDIRKYNLPRTVAAFHPCLMIVHGDRDEIIPVENAHRAGELNPEADLAIIPGADHMFIHPEHRALITAKVTEWFCRVL